MQLNHTLLAVLIASSLVACGGGNLEGGGNSNSDTTTETDTTSPDTDITVPDTDITTPEAPAEAGVPASFVYVGATPAWIAVKGTGGVGRQESSVVAFKLIDRNGNPVEGVAVDFTVSAPSGTTIDPLTGTTNSEGVISTTVLSGTVSGPVRVSVITADDTGITNISESLSVSTGLPDQDSISLSFGTNAPEALNIDGVTTPVTIRLADKYNNAVPDGTTIYFTTEGGAIRDADTGTVGSCLTSASKCSLTWESQNPRPVGNRLDVEGLSNGCATWAFGPHSFAPCINSSGMGQPYGGRATVTAYAQGEEIFVDNDGDGWFTQGDDFFAKNNLSEVFYDHNEDGFYKEESGATNIGDEQEEYADIAPKDGVYSDGTGTDYINYNGLLCSTASESAGLCSRKPIYVRASGVIVMAASVPYIRVQNNNTDTGSIDLTGTNVSQELTVYLAGIYNNAPPSGTTVSVSTDNGEFSGLTSWVVGNEGFGPFSFTFTMVQEESPNTKTNGIVQVLITTPGGNGIEGTKTIYSMSVIDDPAP